MFDQRFREQQNAYEQWRRAYMSPQQIANEQFEKSLSRVEAKLDEILSKITDKGE